MFSTAKKIWDTLKATYAHEKNIARVAELYDQFFALQQDDMSIEDLYTSIRVVLDELEIYPLTLLLGANIRRSLL